jgi:Hint domain
MVGASPPEQSPPTEQWVSDGDGNWDVASNWSNGFVPASVDANLTPANATTTNNFAVTFQDGDSYTIFSLEAPAYATLDVTGGTLTVSNGMSFAGNVEMTGGTIELQNNASEIDGVLDNSGGTVTIDANAQLNLDGGSNNLGGTIAGAGTLDVAIGLFSLSSNIDMQVANWIVDSAATVNLSADLSYGGTFTENDALNLNGHVLTLSGNAMLAGQINGSGSGTDEVVATGAVDVSNLTLDGATELEIKSGATATQENDLNFADDSSFLKIDSGATYTLDSARGETSINSPTPTSDIGLVNAGTLIFQTSAATNTIDTSIENTGTISIISNDAVDFAGGTLTNDGTLTVGFTPDSGSFGTPAELDISSAVTADTGKTGTFNIEADAKLELSASIAASQTIAFAPEGSGTLEIDDLARDADGTQQQDFNAKVAGTTDSDLIEISTTGLGKYDTIDGHQLTVSGDNTLLTLTDGGAIVATLTLAGTGYSGVDVAPDPNTSGIIDVTFASGATTPGSGDTATCYCPGTLIQTDRGEVAVDELRIGDTVVTMSGAARPIRWIGRRSYAGRFALGRRGILPICIKAGALDAGLPRRDLWISPHHAMYLDGVLIEAKDLVNGVSIVQAAQVDKVEYFHIELETHNVILAEGAWSETYVDDDNREMFHNAHEYGLLYPAAALQRTRYCAPRVADGYEVEVARRRIDVRAGLRSVTEPRAGALRGFVDVISPRRIAGWAQDPERPASAVCVDVFADGRLIGQALANRYRADLDRAGIGDGRHSFEFSPPPGLCFSPDAIEVRRSLDGMRLGWCGASAAA